MVPACLVLSYIKLQDFMVTKSKTKLQITKEYKWQLWNDEDTGKGSKLSENTWTESWTEKSYDG